MALRILRGTNDQRKSYVPQQGELIFVTDFQTANADPLYVGDGVTAGGVAVGQNAVLSGSVEGDIQLNSPFRIEGSGEIDISGDITSGDKITAGSISVTTDGIIVAAGNVDLEAGDINVIGNIEASNNITAENFIGGLSGNVTSSDSVLLMVDGDQKIFAGEKITLDQGPGPKIEITSTSIKHISDDPETQILLGSEENPTSMIHYRTYPERIFGRVTLDEDSNIIWPNGTQAITYRGTLENPQSVQAGDWLQGLLVQSYNSSGSLGFAGGHLWVAEDQTGAAPGVIPSTYVLGSGTNFATIVGNAISTQNFAGVLGENLALKYTSQGQLKIGTLVLAKTTNAQRLQLPYVDGTMLYNLSSNEIQILVAGAWKRFVLQDATPD
jgi:cytoskeletal protein CcmA (bactofilin family)